MNVASGSRYFLLLSIRLLADANVFLQDLIKENDKLRIRLENTQALEHEVTSLTEKLEAKSTLLDKAIEDIANLKSRPVGQACVKAEDRSSPAFPKDGLRRIPTRHMHAESSMSNKDMSGYSHRNNQQEIAETGAHRSSKRAGMSDDNAPLHPFTALEPTEMASDMRTDNPSFP